MNYIDLMILLVVKGIAILVCLLGLLMLAYAVTHMIFKHVCTVIGLPIVEAAVKEYRKNHPEKFKKLDAVNKIVGGTKR